MNSFHLLVYVPFLPSLILASCTLPYLLFFNYRCWKLHFVFHINKRKLMQTDYKSWFQRSKFYVSDRFLVPVSCSFICSLLRTASLPILSLPHLFHRCDMIDLTKTYISFIALLGVLGFVFQAISKENRWETYVKSLFYLILKARKKPSQAHH